MPNVSALKWDQVGERTYETGTKKGVLYPQVGAAYPHGVAWNGLSAVTESPDGAEATDIYADDIKYLSLRSVENYKGTIEAYTYPDEFAACDGSASVAAGVTIGQQPRKPFGFSWVTTIGNDTEYDDYGYKIHLVWGATVSPSEKSYQTINDSPEAITFSWELDTIPVAVEGHKATSHMEIDSTKCDPDKLTALEEILYGKDGTADTYTALGASASFASNTTYYERVGTAEPYAYVETTDTTKQEGKTYYTKTAGTGVEAHLPLPDDIIDLFTST